MSARFLKERRRVRRLVLAAVLAAGAAAGVGSASVLADEPAAVPPITVPPVTVPPVTVPTLPPVTTPPPPPPPPPVTVAPPPPPPVTIGTPAVPTTVRVDVEATVAVTVTTPVDDGPGGTVEVDADLCVTAGLTGEVLAQCRASGNAGTVRVDLCVAAGLVDDALEQCRADGGTAVADADLCVAAGLTGPALAQCQASRDGDSVVDLDLCAAGGTAASSSRCAGSGGGPVGVDLCLAAGLTGDALAQCRGGEGGGTVVNVDLCAAAGLAGEALAQCRTNGTGSVADVDLCVAAGLAGDALAQCQRDSGDDSIVQLDLCVAAGAAGDASAQCSGLGGGPVGVDLCVSAGLVGDALAQCRGGGGGSSVGIDLCLAAGLVGDALSQCRDGTGNVPPAELCVAAGLVGDALVQCQDAGGSGVAFVNGVFTLNLCTAAGATAESFAPCLTAGEDLRAGAVYTMSNDPEDNVIVALFRAADGTLSPAGRYPTGGLGSGGFEESSHGLVLGSIRGEGAPTNLTDTPELLFAVNAGSDDITVLRVTATGLEVADVEPSNGAKPVSVTVHDGLVYVLNSGEAIDGTLDAMNCREGDEPSVTGFRLDAEGELTPIADSTRPLTGGTSSGCAQVSFSPDGRRLIVSQRTAAMAGQSPGNEGSFDSFVVNEDGTLGDAQAFDTTGQGPLGFAFTDAGALVTAEQSGGPYGAGRGSASGYTMGADGALTASGPSVTNGGTGTGWIAVTNDGALGFASSFFDGGRLSSYAVAPDGSLAVLQPDAAPDVAEGTSDLTLSRDGRYLYLLNSLDGTVGAFEVTPDGAVARIDTEPAHEPDPMGAPFGIAAS